MINLRYHKIITRILVVGIFLFLLIFLVYFELNNIFLTVKIIVGLLIIILTIFIYNLIKMIIFNIPEISYNSDILISTGAAGVIKVNLHTITNYEIKIYGRQMAVCLYTDKTDDVFKNSSFLAWFFIKFSLDNNLGVAPVPILILQDYYDHFIGIIEKNIEEKNKKIFKKV